MILKKNNVIRIHHCPSCGRPSYTKELCANCRDKKRVANNKATLLGSAVSGGLLGWLVGKSIFGVVAGSVIAMKIITKREEEKE